MLRVMCDGCGKELHPGDDRHVVRIEVFATADVAGLTDDDLDADHMEAMSELIRELEDADDTVTPEPARREMRYDLCSPCRRRWLRDPLGREATPKLLFGAN